MSDRHTYQIEARRTGLVAGGVGPDPSRAAADHAVMRAREAARQLRELLGGAQLMFKVIGEHDGAPPLDQGDQDAPPRPSPLPDDFSPGNRFMVSATSLGLTILAPRAPGQPYMRSEALSLVAWIITLAGLTTAEVAFALEAVQS